tara:strand:+ start:300 stop:416 length:117 start_codon:yes stop_codon:yes gene_type:complete
MMTLLLLNSKPTVVDGMKDAKHTCAFCAREVGEKKLIG